MVTPSDEVQERDDAGVDLTLIDSLAALTPTERLRLNDEAIAGILELRAAFARSVHEPDADPHRPR